MTPAQALGLSMKDDWHNLVNGAMKSMAKKEEKRTERIVEVVI